MTSLFGTSRTAFEELLIFYSIAFGAYTLLALGTVRISVAWGLGMALLIRLIGFCFEPLLSDDYFRFIWDGMMSDHGFNPVAFTPDQVVANPDQFQVDTSLYRSLNSPAYHSVYPPVAQLLFQFSYGINQGNIAGHIITMKLIALACDGLIIYLLLRLLKQYDLPRTLVLGYALNPLVIIELSGNLHPEGLMIAGLLGAMVLMNRNQSIWAGAAGAVSVMVKLVTLPLLPFLSKTSNWKKMIPVALCILILLIAGFTISFGTHTEWLGSVRLWFQRFEFNAGLYYLIRWCIAEWKGYNAIAWIGPLMALGTIVIMIWTWFRFRKNEALQPATAMLVIITAYYLLSTTIHPWYLALPLCLGLLSPYRFPIAWTYLGFLSYSHYDNGLFRENYLLIAAEYLLLVGFIIWELSQRDRVK